MRTTINIDDDLLAAAKSLSKAKSEPIGRVVSDLMRRGLRAGAHTGQHTRNGIPLFSVSEKSRPISLEDVNKIHDEL